MEKPRLTAVPTDHQVHTAAQMDRRVNIVVKMDQAASIVVEIIPRARFVAKTNPCTVIVHQQELGRKIQQSNQLPRHQHTVYQKHQRLKIPMTLFSTSQDLVATRMTSANKNLNFMSINQIL